jgi:ribonucleoside-triphosphate reductase
MKETCNKPCEVYTRVCGYIRPVSGFNTGKQQEYKDRKKFSLK